MRRKTKPDIFLGITMCMLVLAAVLCIVILFVQKNKGETPSTEPSQVETTSSTPSQTNYNVGTTTEGGETIASTAEQQPPEDLKPIKDVRLKADLDESLRGLTSEWQVMVIDPVFDTKVGSSVNCGVDNWMTANRMTQVYIMGTVFQQIQEGKLTLEDTQEDLKAMIAGDTYAADRLTEKVGGGDASKGREAVKTFAVANGVKLGFNRPNTSGSQKNYVSAQYNAEILNLICSGKLVSSDASRQMLDILLTPVDNLEIETGLQGEDLRYGFIVDVEPGTCICAMGVVSTPKRSFVISVVCNNPVTTDGAKKKLTELISLVQPYFAE